MKFILPYSFFASKAKVDNYEPDSGWAMGANSFIFLDRLWEKDEQRLEDMIEYYAQAGAKYQVNGWIRSFSNELNHFQLLQILLFPEGTDKCHRATARCRAYADKKGLQQYDYVMHPKTTGFVYLLQKMRKGTSSISWWTYKSYIENEANFIRINRCQIDKNVLNSLGEGSTVYESASRYQECRNFGV